MDQENPGKGGRSRPGSDALPQAGAGDPRKARLAAALRDNLKKRKAQGRARAAGEVQSATPGENPARSS